MSQSIKIYLSATETEKIKEKKTAKYQKDVKKYEINAYLLFQGEKL